MTPLHQVHRTSDRSTTPPCPHVHGRVVRARLTGRKEVLTMQCARAGAGANGSAWGQLSGLGGALKKVQPGSGTVTAKGTSCRFILCRLT
jgi:hypothetical protein